MGFQCDHILFNEFGNTLIRRHILCINGAKKQMITKFIPSTLADKFHWILKVIGICPVFQRKKENYSKKQLKWEPFVVLFS